MIVAIIAIVVVIVIAIFAVQSTRNHAIVLEEAIKTADSDMKVQEKRRIDLIYNLVDCVKQYDAHEADTLTKLAEEMGSGNRNVDDSKLITSLNATAYQYPELKSSAVYQDLMNELSVTENMIASHRENYNGSVNDYNRYVRQFPANIFLPLSGYSIQKYDRLDFHAPVDAPQNLFAEKK